METSELPREPGVYPAQTEAEKQAVYRFRYDIYVEELGRYRSIADHTNRVLIEPDDANSRLYFAIRDGELAGTMRLTWGGDAPFPERQVEQYDLDLFLGEVSPKQMLVCERFMISKGLRGSDVLFSLFCTYLAFVNEHRIQLIFEHCKPHFLNLYIGLGFRTYARRNVNSPETGYLIPLVMVAEDLDYLRRVESPLTEILKDFGADSRVPALLERILAQDSAVLSQRLHTKQRYWSEVFQALDGMGDQKLTLFDGLSPAEIQDCLDRSSIITCSAGDWVVKKGSRAKNLFVVLDGILEVRDEDRPIGILDTGEVFGEIAFLLDLPRTRDVYAATEGTRVLSLSESAIRGLIESKPEVAAKMLLNISKMLCLRLVWSTQLY